MVITRDCLAAKNAPEGLVEWFTDVTEGKSSALGSWLLPASGEVVLSPEDWGIQRGDLVLLLKTCEAGDQVLWNRLGLALLRITVNGLSCSSGLFTETVFALTKAADQLNWCANATRLDRLPGEFVAELYQQAVESLLVCDNQQRVVTLDRAVMGFLVSLSQGAFDMDD